MRSLQKTSLTNQNPMFPTFQNKCPISPPPQLHQRLLEWVSLQPSYVYFPLLNFWNNFYTIKAVFWRHNPVSHYEGRIISLEKITTSEKTSQWEASINLINQSESHISNVSEQVPHESTPSILSTATRIGKFVDFICILHQHQGYANLNNPVFSKSAI